MTERSQLRAGGTRGGERIEHRPQDRDDNVACGKRQIGWRNTRRVLGVA